jgi:hypothetical protein
MSSKNFVSLVSLRKYAARKGLSVRKTTVAKKNVYYKVISKADGIVGYFNERPNTNRGFGHVDA